MSSMDNSKDQNFVFIYAEIEKSGGLIEKLQKPYKDLKNLVENQKTGNWDCTNTEIQFRKDQISAYLNLVPLFLKIKNWGDLEELLIQEDDDDSVFVFQRDTAIMAEDEGYSETLEYFKQTQRDLSSVRKYLFSYVVYNIENFMTMIEEA